MTERQHRMVKLCERQIRFNEEVGRPDRVAHWISRLNWWLARGE